MRDEYEAKAFSFQSAPRRDDGWGWIELMGATVMLLLAVMGVTSVLVGSTRLNEESRENVMLTVAAGNIMETLEAEPFETLYQTYGFGTDIESFWVLEDGSVVTEETAGARAKAYLYLFRDESGIPAEFADFGTGFDLNANGSVDTGVVNDYRVLPIRIVFDVLNPLFPRTETLEFILTSVR
ncbi:MAG: hypothetical protein AAF517_17005 [Planctomycetota bacterium]